MSPDRAARPSEAELRAAVERRVTVPDVVAPGLDVLFCGINPGRWSGATGHHFAHPGNRFWKVLHLSGFTDRLLTPAEEPLLLGYRLGVTNLVRRTTTSAAEVTPEELRRAAAPFERLVRRIRPQAVAFLGIGAYRTAFGRPDARPGPQPGRLGGAQVWVLPNPSGLQAHYRVPELVDQLRSLRAAVRATD